MSTLKTIKLASDKRSVNVEIFESVQELAKLNRVRPSRHSGNHLTATADSWNGKLSYTGAEEMMVNGWSEKVEELKIETKKIGLKETGKRITSRNDVVGYAPIVPLAIIGVPESMINQTYKPIKSKVINLYYDITVCANHSANEIMKNGMEVMKVIINLEKQGYRVELNAMQAYNDDKGSDMLIVKLKSSNQPLDIKRVMFPLMHPAMFRTIGFTWYERCPLSVAKSGYGHTFDREYCNNKDAVIKELFGKNATYISGDSMVKGNNVETILKGEAK